MFAIFKLFVARNIFMKRLNNALIFNEIQKVFLMIIVDFRQILLNQIE